MIYRQDCLENINDKKISLSEKKTKCYIDNSDQKDLIKIQVDGCQITDNSIKKCDWLIIDDQDKIEIYIELKGSNTRTAAEQIEESVKRLKKHNKVYGYIIFNKNKYPRLNQKIVKDFRKKKIILFLEKSGHKIEIEKLL